MTLKALVFDLDGTLVDQEGAERDALAKLYETEVKLDPAPGFRDFLRVWRTAADDYLQRFLDNKMSFEQQRTQRFEAIYKAFGQECPAAEAQRLHLRYAELYRAQWRAFDEVKAVLEALKKDYRLAVVTNGDAAQQKAKLVATELLGFFETVVASGDLKIAKPDAGIFKQCEREMNLSAQEMAYIGDRLDVDIAGAKNAGWTPIFLDRKAMPGSGEQGVLVVHRLSDLPGRLKG